MRRAGFPWPLPEAPDDAFAPLWRLDGQAVWVPQELVGLGPRIGAARLPSTSSGLAAQRRPVLALLRAVQEVLERDALAVTWLHGLGGRRIPLPPRWRAAVAALGVARRARRADALDKAATEWAQSLAFARHLAYGPEAARLPREPAALRRFDEHAAFYTLRPELWPRTPFIAHAAPWQPPPEAAAPEAPKDQLRALAQALAAAGIALLYRELTTPDVAASGLHVLRALAPALTGLHADERAPFLGGRTADVGWRYPGARGHGAYPNPLPHPLG